MTEQFVRTAMKNPANYWTPQQVEAILETAKNPPVKIKSNNRIHRKVNSMMYYLLFKWLWLSGRRISEVIGTRNYLKQLYTQKDAKKTYFANPEKKRVDYKSKIIGGVRVSDILPEEASVVYHIAKKKTDTRTVIRMPESFLIEVFEYIRLHQLKGDDPIFKTSYGMAQRRLQEVLDNTTYKTESGEEVPVRRGSLHTFRHSFATNAARVLTIPELKYHLQHRDAETTLVYAHPSEDYADRLFASLEGKVKIPDEEKKEVEGSAV